MRVISKSVKDTLNTGKLIARNLQKGDIVCLLGELGSGKTVLTRGIVSGLKAGRAAVTSPSFVLMREYPQGRIPLYHFDLYRIKAQKDILGLGLEEYLYSDGVSVIEWADRLKCFLPKEFLKVELSFKDGSRRMLQFSAFGSRYKTLLEKIDAHTGD